jgi:hypothetical protein
MFIHYLVTRFNIKVTHFGPEQMNSPEMDLDWLNKRLDLFLKFCAPSVLEQTNNKFTWLIYFDPATPQSILEKIQFLKTNIIQTEFIFIGNYEMMIEDLKQRIKNTPASFVITSRLDNDDVISNSFIDDIQKSFVPRHDTIINFMMGYEYNIRKHILTKWNARSKNQFISIIEERDALEVKSIYGFPHWRLPVNSAIINIISQPNWIYLGHNLNHSSLPVTGIPLYQKPEGLKRFPYSIRKVPISFTQTMLYSFAWLPRVIKRRFKKENKTVENSGLPEDH